MNYKLRTDLQIYKPKQLASTFVEANLKGKSFLIGCIYRHTCMKVSEFNDHFLSSVLEKLSYANNAAVLLGVFSVDLPKYDTNKYI